MQDFQKVAGSYYQLLQKNPVVNSQEQLICWWYDQLISAFLKLHYWPAFVAGTSDNIVDLLKPQTYNICRI